MSREILLIMRVYCTYASKSSSCVQRRWGISTRLELPQEQPHKAHSGKVQLEILEALLELSLAMERKSRVSRRQPLTNSTVLKAMNTFTWRYSVG